MSNLWKSLKELVGVSKVDDEELKRSQYSLVSCGELTNDTLQLWMGLPDEVKNDPSLAPLKLLYEKEYGSDSLPKKAAGSNKRLPSVNSAPVISPSLQVLAQDIELLETKNCDVLDLNNEVETAEGGNVQKNLRKGTSKISINKKTQKYSSAKYYTKMSLLLACWLTFTAAFISYNEKIDVTKLTSIAPGEVKNYTLHPPYSEVRIAIKLRGPFLTEHAQIKAGDSSHKMQVVLQRLAMENGSRFSVVEESSPWVILLQDHHELDFTQGEIRSTILHLTSMLNATEYVYNLHMSTTSNQTTPVLMGIQVDPLQPSTGVVYAIVLLTGLYVLIIFEVINRTMAAITVATMSIATLAMAGERPSLPEIISWLDEETLLLLFSMMLLVAIMAETGIFDFLAVFTFEVTKGKLWPLIYLLCAITAVLSTFLDNVTTVLLMSPVTIRLCEVMELDPVPILMLMAIYSNIGGTATPVGDPPNVIVASNKAVIQSGVNFTNFTAHMTLGIVLVCIQTSIQIRIMFRDTNKLRLSVPREIQVSSYMLVGFEYSLYQSPIPKSLTALNALLDSSETPESDVLAGEWKVILKECLAYASHLLLDITQQIKIWRRAADSLPHLSKDVLIVRERLERKISKLSDQLACMVKESKSRACPRDTFNTTLQELKTKYKIRDKVLLVKSSVAITFVVVVFFLHAIPELNRMSLSWTALLGAILLLILADREDLEPVLHKVEWSTLLFFAALFVLMEALSKLGLILYIGGLMEHLILNVGEDARLAVSLMLILWVSGMISAFVDNIPLTTMMVRVVVAIGSNPHLNLPMQPLIWALLCGACLGGNGTLIGASANVVCAGVAELHGYRITFGRFFKVGFPIMIGHLVMASIYLLICHCVFAWH